MPLPDPEPVPDGVRVGLAVRVKVVVPVPVKVIGGLKDAEPDPVLVAVRLARLWVASAVKDGETEAVLDPEPVVVPDPVNVPEGLKEMVVEPVGV